MQLAMSKQAEAEREQRAKVIDAEGGYQAAEKLAQTARVLASAPIAVQLRFLQTIREWPRNGTRPLSSPRPSISLRPS